MENIYLAGRVGGPKYEIARSINDFQAVFVSSDGGNHSEHNIGGGYDCISDCVKYNADFVREDALARIDECDFLIAIITDCEAYGTIAEIAYAAAKQKKCHIIIRKEDHISDWNYKDAYWFISCFPGVTVRTVYCDCMVTKEIKKILTYSGVKNVNDKNYQCV